MGEIIIKIPGDIREIIELNKSKICENAIKKTEKLLDIIFLNQYFQEVKHSIELEKITEEELHLQGD